MKMPKIGGRKLYFMLNEKKKKKNLKTLKIGRDKFLTYLKANHLLITPKRSYPSPPTLIVSGKHKKFGIRLSNYQTQPSLGSRYYLHWK